MITTGPGESYFLNSCSELLSPVNTKDLGCKAEGATSAPSQFQQRTGSEVLWSSTESLWLMPDPASNCVQFTNLPQGYGGWVSTYTKDNGGWWIGTRNNGLWRLETTANAPAVIVKGFKVPIPGDLIRTLWRDDNYLWIGTSGAGLLRYDPILDSFLQFNLYHSGSTKISGSIVSGFTLLPDSTYLVATRSGLDRIDPISGNAQPIPFRLKGNLSTTRPEISFLHLDEWDTIWVGHDAGISFVSAYMLLTSSIPLDNTAAVGPVSAVADNPNDQRIWIGTNGHLLSTRRNGSGLKVELEVGKITGFVANNTVTDIVPLDDQIYVATGSHGIVYRNETGAWSSGFLRDSAAVSPERSALRDIEIIKDYLILATAGAGVIHWPLTSRSIEQPRISSPVDVITSLAKESDQRMLVGSLNRGAFWYTQSNAEFVKALPWEHVDEMLDIGIIHDVAIAKDGQYFAGTSGGLVYWSESDTTWGVWSEKDGIPADLINNVVSKDSGEVWFSTEKAVCQWMRHHERPSCLGVIESESSESIQPRSMAIFSDFVFWGTSRSVGFMPTKVFPHFRTRPVSPLKLRLEGDEGDARTFNHSGGQSRFHPLTSVVRLQAELATFAEGENVKVGYQLLGIDPQPIYSNGTLIAATFHELPHRKEPYLLNVEVWDSSGRLYATNLSFTLPLPFWKTLWFLLSSFSLLSSLAAWQTVKWYNRRRQEARELQLALASGREQERSNLSRQIHDLALQQLYVVRQNLNRLEPPHESKAFASIERSVAEATQELRRLCGELLPPSLGPFGLEAAINSFLQGIRSANPDLNVALDVSIRAEPNTENALAVVRALQASIANVVRHAQASRVAITIRCDSDSIALSVSDNGKGFDIPLSLISLARNRHYGLLGLHELAKQHGGELKVASKPGTGTIIRFQIANDTAAHPSNSIAENRHGPPFDRYRR